MDLLAALRLALGETFAFYFLAHSHHWNVRGPLFPQLHGLFGSIYEDAHDAVDTLAERIRTLGVLAPASLQGIAAPATIVFTEPPDAAGMVLQLIAGNDAVIKALDAANAAAQSVANDGLANILQERLDVHAKWAWQLRSITE